MAIRASKASTAKPAAVSLDEQDAFSEIGEHPGDDASSGARLDDDGVEMLRRAAQGDFGQRIGFVLSTPSGRGENPIASNRSRI